MSNEKAKPMSKARIVKPLRAASVDMNLLNGVEAYNTCVLHDCRIDLSKLDGRASYQVKGFGACDLKHQYFQPQYVVRGEAYNPLVTRLVNAISLVLNTGYIIEPTVIRGKESNIKAMLGLVARPLNMNGEESTEDSDVVAPRFLFSSFWFGRTPKSSTWVLDSDGTNTVTTVTTVTTSTGLYGSTAFDILIQG